MRDSRRAGVSPWLAPVLRASWRPLCARAASGEAPEPSVVTALPQAHIMHHPPKHFAVPNTLRGLTHDPRFSAQLQ
eukprot:6531240-Alexandrium_andersonii.AAC.1